MTLDQYLTETNALLDQLKEAFSETDCSIEMKNCSWTTIRFNVYVSKATEFGFTSHVEFLSFEKVKEYIAEIIAKHSKQNKKAMLAKLMEDRAAIDAKILDAITAA